MYGKLRQSGKQNHAVIKDSLETKSLAVIYEQGAQNNNLDNKSTFKKKLLKWDKSEAESSVMLISCPSIIFISTQGN